MEHVHNDSYLASEYTDKYIDNQNSGMWNGNSSYEFYTELAQHTSLNDGTLTITHQYFNDNEIHIIEKTETQYPYSPLSLENSNKVITMILTECNNSFNNNRDIESMYHILHKLHQTAKNNITLRQINEKHANVIFNIIKPINFLNQTSYFNTEKSVLKIEYVNVISFFYRYGLQRNLYWNKEDNCACEYNPMIESLLENNESVETEKWIFAMIKVHGKAMINYLDTCVLNLLSSYALEMYDHIDTFKELPVLNKRTSLKLKEKAFVIYVDHLVRIGMERPHIVVKRSRDSILTVKLKKRGRPPTRILGNKTNNVSNGKVEKRTTTGTLINNNSSAINPNFLGLDKLTNLVQYNAVYPSSNKHNPQTWIDGLVYSAGNRPDEEFYAPPNNSSAIGVFENYQNNPPLASSNSFLYNAQYIFDNSELKHSTMHSVSSTASPVFTNFPAPGHVSGNHKASWMGTLFEQR